MRFAVLPVVLGLALLASHPASAAPRPSGNHTILPLASTPPTVTVNASARTTTSSTSTSNDRPIMSQPAYGGAISGATTDSSGGHWEEDTYEGEGCIGQLFGESASDDSEETTVVVAAPPSNDPEPGQSTTKDDDDDDKNKEETKPSKSDDDNSKSDDDGTTKTLNVAPTLHGTHAMATPVHHAPSPVSRATLAGVVILLPLRRRRRKA